MIEYRLLYFPESGNSYQRALMLTLCLLSPYGLISAVARPGRPSAGASSIPGLDSIPKGRRREAHPNSNDPLALS